MFAFAIFIGIYSYASFVAGLLQLLTKEVVLLISVFWIISVGLWYKHDIGNLTNYAKHLYQFFLKQSVFSRIILLLICVVLLIAYIGVFLPETSFDALWYHLTIPKLFIQNYSLWYIPGGLYFYSLMPKLVDLLYIPAVFLNSEVLAKTIHFMFAVLISVTLFNLAKKYLTTAFSLLVVLIFLSNLVVLWLSSAAYIDLGRTFFELMAVYGIVLYSTEKKELWIIESAVMMGFAIATKVLAVTSLPILLLFLWLTYSQTGKKKYQYLFKYVVIALLVPLPYSVFSFIQSGNPFYPLFSQYYVTLIEPSVTHIPSLIQDIWASFVISPDPINPIYAMSIPLFALTYKKFSKREKYLGYITIFALCIWLFVPRTGGGRFLLPYLPLLSLLIGIVFAKITHTRLLKFYLAVCIVIAVTSIVVRGIVLFEHRAYLLKQQTKAEYLAENLNFEYGDFYDIDGYFANHLSKEDRVLIYGIHNLYYVDFPFVHESYVQPGDEFNYILISENAVLPDRFYVWKEVYHNPQTGVILYSQEGNTWVY